MILKRIIGEEFENIVATLQDFIKIPSIEGEPKKNMPFGEAVDQALENALALGKKMGFRTRNIDHYAGEIEFGDGNETIGILVHLDVVPVGEGWNYPPFAAEIHQGKVYGRGSIDNKSSFVTCLYAMKAIKESQLPLKRKIRMILGTNEETRWEGIEYYLSKNKEPDFSIVPDANFPVLQGEKGVLVLDLNQGFSDNSERKSILIGIVGGVAVNSVPDSCKVRLDRNSVAKEQLENLRSSFDFSFSFDSEEDHLICNFKGKSAHACVPEDGLNAISLAFGFLDEICSQNDPARSFIDWYRSAIGMEFNGESLGCGFEDEISGKLTLNVGRIRWDVQGVAISLDIRYPLTIPIDEVVAGINNELQPTDITFKISNKIAPIYFESDHFLIQTLLDIYQRETGDFESKPTIIGGATYARAIKNAVAFGPEFPGDQFAAHLKDEYVALERLKQCANIYTQAIYELAKQEKNVKKNHD